MELYIPKTGDIFSVCIKNGYHSISLGRMFRWSSVAGFCFRRPHQEPQMTALTRLFELVKLDQMPRLICQKCIRYPINFHTSIRRGNELEYSGYDKTFFQKLFKRQVKLHIPPLRNINHGT